MNNNTHRAALAGVALFLLIIGAVTVTYLYSSYYKSVNVTAGNYSDEKPEDIRFGINFSDFKVLEHVVKPGEIFSEILSRHNVAYNTIHMLAKESESIFSIRKIKAGNQCTILCEESKEGLVPKKMIYEASKVDYVVFNLDDSLYIYRGQNKVTRVQREVSGIINSSLYETMEQNDINPALAVRMAEIFAWSIDFYKIQQGDRFKIIYDEDFSGEESVGIGAVKAVLFNSAGKDYYAFYYEKDKLHEGDYYDEKGASMRRQFLKAPVKFSRISSRFSMKRFHPVSKRWKAHLGTDYAAPHGTPIMATADGVVEEAQYKAANGNYVKIRHNGSYKTQYLHMSKIGKGIKRGVRVKQGEVIGYVGSTGLATGPHVCYRFWKDGQQVDPYRQSLTFSDPLPSRYLNDFLNKTASVKKQIDHISFTEHNMSVIKQKKETEAQLRSRVAADLKQVF